MQAAAARSGAELPAGRTTMQVFEDALGERGEFDISSITSYVRILGSQKE